MYSSLQLARKCVLFYFGASSRKGHGVHSPFVYDFIRQVLLARTEKTKYLDIEALRKELLKSPLILDIEDFGAGSGLRYGGRRRIADVAKRSAKPPKWAELLARIAGHYQPALILELGTSLGISSAYLARGNPAARVITVEGSVSLATEARKNLQALGLGRVEVRTGEFDQLLPDLVGYLPSLDLVFVDGNHRKDPTLRYFHLLLPHMASRSIMVFDDIHWSKEMEQAWSAISRDSRICLSIDLFFFGLVFFNPQCIEKQNFRIRF
jgi:predicted O-methyltransferase YrrM